MGVKFLLILCLAGGVTAAGYLNYQRNAALDEGLDKRRYARLDAQALEILVQAYEREIERLTPWLGDEPIQETGVAAPPGDMASFDRHQRALRQWRTQRAEIQGHEATLEELRREQGVRSQGLDNRWERIRRRVLRF